MTNERIGKVAIVWRGSPKAREKATAQGNRLSPIFEALEHAGLSAEPAVYNDDMLEELRQQLLGVDGVLVWVDPIGPDGDRKRLEALLREVSDGGVWVSSHPDTILALGTKSVLVQTKSLGWGSDCHLYESAAQLREHLPRRLASGGTRVLKQVRGNGGQGVYRVALVDPPADPGDAVTAEAIVHTQHARFGSTPKDLALGDFMSRLEKHFADGQPMIDQPFQERLAEGMIRCYMVGGEVVGFGHQLIKALLAPPPQGLDSPEALPGPRIMSGASAPAFQELRRRLQSEWIPGMQSLLEVPTDRLPAIWDADFLYGPRDESGQDSYVLCEINVCAVLPVPDEAIPRLAQAAAAAIANATPAP